MSSKRPPELARLAIELPLPPRVLWPNARPHWSAKARASRRYRRDARYTALEALAGRPRPRWPAAELQATFYFPCRRRRDRDNALAALKPAFDGLQDAGLVADDSGLTHLPVALDLDRTRPRVELVITATPTFEGDPK